MINRLHHICRADSYCKNFPRTVRFKLHGRTPCGNIITTNCCDLLIGYKALTAIAGGIAAVRYSGPAHCCFVHNNPHIACLAGVADFYYRTRNQCIKDFLRHCCACLCPRITGASSVGKLYCSCLIHNIYRSSLTNLYAEYFPCTGSFTLHGGTPCRNIIAAYCCNLLVGYLRYVMGIVDVCAAIVRYSGPAYRRFVHNKPHIAVFTGKLNFHYGTRNQCIDDFLRHCKSSLCPAVTGDCKTFKVYGTVHGHQIGYIQTAACELLRSYKRYGSICCQQIAGSVKETNVVDVKGCIAIALSHTIVRLQAYHQKVACICDKLFTCSQCCHYLGRVLACHINRPVIGSLCQILAAPRNELTGNSAETTVVIRSPDGHLHGCHLCYVCTQKCCRIKRDIRYLACQVLHLQCLASIEIYNGKFHISGICRLCVRCYERHIAILKVDACSFVCRCCHIRCRCTFFRRRCCTGIRRSVLSRLVAACCHGKYHGSCHKAG